MPLAETCHSHSCSSLRARHLRHLRSARCAGLHVVMILALLCCSGLATTRASVPSASAHPAAVPLAGGNALQADAGAASDSNDANDANANDSADALPDFRAARAHRPHRGQDDRVSIGHDTDLPPGQTADSVVSVGGSSSSEGTVRQDVVSVFGSTRVTGSTGGDAVAVLGSTYVDGHVGGDAVAVLGSVRLGPHAEIDGNVTAVGGHVQRDPDAIVHGGIQEVGLGHGVGAGFAPWIQHGMFYLRPLAWSLGLAWVWALALGFLALYVILALAFPGGIERCAQTLQSAPGPSVLTALLAALLTPLLLLLLVVTLIGIAAVPLMIVALVIASLFGKAAVLAWIGGRVLEARAAPAGPGNAPRLPPHAALRVLVGGAIVLVLYLVPVLGFVVFQALGLLGLGVVIYTLIQSSHRHRGAPLPGGSAGGTGPMPGTVPPGATAGQPGTAASAVPPGFVAPPPAPDGPPPGAPPGASPSSAASGGFTTRAVDPAHAAAAQAATLGTYAGFWVRMGALLLDVLLVSIVVRLLHEAFHLELLALATYGALMWKLRGTTVGGIVFDLHVVRIDGRPLDWGTAIVRALGCFLSLAIVGLGFFWIAFDDSKQAWHDKIAGTVVVRVARAASLV